MSIPTGVSRVQFRGTAPGGEIFETGFWIHGAPTSNSDASTDAGKIVTEFSSHSTSIKKLIRSDTVYTEVRLYSYPSGGPVAEFVGVAPIVGGAGTSTNQGLPLQCSIVCSLLTEQAGRSGRGRMYFPASGAAMDSVNHQLDPTLNANLANEVALLLAGVNDEGVGQPSVVSQKGSGALGPIGSVRVDSRFDIQRRRAAKQAPNTVTIVSTGLV